MGVGTSLGAFYDDKFHQSAAQWDPDKYDENVSDISKAVDEATGKANGADDPSMEVTPLEVSKGNIEHNITDPKIMMGNRMVDSDPRNIYNDAGDIVDFSLQRMPEIVPADQLNIIDQMTK